MSQTNPSPEINGDHDLKRIAADRDDIPHHAQLLGIDGEGAAHVHSPRADRVWVVDSDPDAPVDSALTHSKPTPDIWAWIDHTAECRGWDELRYDRGSFAEALARTIAEAQR